MVHFSNEIWLEVASYLKLPTDVCTRKNEAADKAEKITQQTLISLCHVSKQLHAVFQPQLYCNFVKDSRLQHNHHQLDEPRSRSIRKQPRLENFLATIIQRPDLAAMVEQIRIGSLTPGDALPSYYEEVDVHKTTSRALVADLRSFKRYDCLSDRFRRSWKKSLRGGDEEAEVALLLTLLPKLRSLRFDLEEGSLNYFMQKIFNIFLDPSSELQILKSTRGMLHKHAVGSQSKLDQSSRILCSLGSLAVRSFDGYKISLENYVGLLSQPSITSFHGRGLTVYGASLSFHSGITFTALRHLQLVRCKLDGDGLESVLKRCTKLQSLTIDTKFALDPDPRILLTTKHLDPLKNMTGTLERLKLMLHEYNIAASLDLRSFGKLRYLHVDSVLLRTNGNGSLYMHELLPTSIEKITIRRAYIWIQEHIDRLLHAMTANRRLSALSTLKVYAFDWDYPGLHFLSESLQEQARGLQLHFQVEKDPSIRYSYSWGHGDPDSDSDLDSN